jgi:hypothetical protein
LYLPLIIFTLAALLGAATPAPSDTNPPSGTSDGINGGGPWGSPPPPVSP